MYTKETPPCCEALTCSFNPVAPPPESQECIGCPHLHYKGWQPDMEEDE